MTARSQTVTATDTVTAGFGTATITVNPAALNKLGVSAPLDSTAGKPFDITVTAQDQYGNTVPSYTGTVHFTKSDGGGRIGRAGKLHVRRPATMACTHSPMASPSSRPAINR